MARHSTGTIAYFLLLSAHLGLVWALPYFPSQDGPGHLYNLVILRDLLHGGEVWGDYLGYRLSLKPNLGFTLAAYPLLAWFSPMVAEKIFLSLYIALMGLSVPLFLRTFGRSVLPAAFLVFPVIFNLPLLMGFYSYALAVPLLLLCLSLGWKVRRRSPAVKFLCLNAAGFLLYFCHLVPFCLFVLALAAAELADDGHRGRKVRGLLTLPLILAPVLANGMYYFARGTGGAAVDFAYLASLRRHAMLTFELFLFSTVNLSTAQLVPAFLLAAVTAVLGYYSLRDFLERRKASIPALSSERYLFATAAVTIFIYLAAPFSFSGGSVFNERFPWVIFLMILPLLNVPKTLFRRWDSGMVLIAVACVFFLFNAVIHVRENDKVEKFLAGLYSDLPKGAVVATYKTERRGWFLTADVLLHGASYYGIFRQSVDIGNIEAQFPHYLVYFKESLTPFPPAGRLAHEPAAVEWRKYPHVRYVLGWGLREGDAKILEDTYRLFWVGNPLSIWERK